MTTAHTFGGGDRITHYSGQEGYIESAFIHSSQHLPFTAHRIVDTGEKELPLADYLPEGFTLRRHHTHGTGGAAWLLAEADDAWVLLQAQPTSYVEISVAAADAKRAEWVQLYIAGKIPVVKVDENQISLGLWQAAEGEAKVTTKKVDAPAWTEVERNYATKTREAVTALMKTSKLDEGNGKIILWHGPPGTGKTSAIRALAREWKDWATAHYISDPEKMFNSPGYLLKVGAHHGEKYRLVIAEDTDEFLRVDAKSKSGAALSRLLNFSDGLLGQGCKVLFLLTTNEPIGKLQPALLRPGRCLAQTEFTPMSGEEVTEWLPEGTPPPVGNKTLAELYEHISNKQQQINTGFGKTNRIGFGN